MEVHHHPNVEKKNFKEYLLEFIMIFLAVTMGFLAESLRENMSDKEKEKEYIQSFVSNLEQDKSALQSSIVDNEKKTKGLDSLMLLSFKNNLNALDKQKLYLYASKHVSFYSVFISNDATMLQLKNSGGLRYIKRDHVADSIAQYDLDMRSVYAAEGPYLKSGDEAMAAMKKLLQFNWFEDTTYYKNYSFTSKELPLLTNDPQQIKIFFNEISSENGWTKNYIGNLKSTLPKTTSLIAFLKKEYSY